MKRNAVLLALTCILFQNLVFGQQDKTKQVKKWTIGGILVNEWNYYNYLGSSTVSRNYFNGITIKRHFKSFTARTGMEYINLIAKQGESSDLGYKAVGYLNESMVRAGIEKGMVVKKKFRPYMALDLAYVRSNSDITYNSFGAIYIPPVRVMSVKNSYGLMPALGLSYTITNALSVSFETRARFLFNQERYKRYYLDEVTNNKRRYSDINWNRIGGITLNVRF